METSLSALAYKGSIPEAILESKKQKKLFVVYISGKDSDSVELEKSTWNDSKVADSLSKYCILLHIQEGSSDAANFSAIYPQKTVPSIAAIGYNGLQLWQKGFVNAEVLASSLEKAWLSLHMQETTATVLTAALASKKLEQSTVTGSSDNGLSQQGSSSGAVVPPALAEEHIQSSDARIPDASEIIDDENVEDGERSTSTSLIDKLSSDDAEKSIPPTKDVHVINSPLALEPDKSLAADGVSSGIKEDKSLAQENIINQNLDFPEENSQLVTSKTDEALLDENDGYLDESHSDVVDNNKRIKTTSDAHLNIRLPDGVSLQEKFSLTSTLRMVKEYVDRNQASGIGSYDLAIPYPRKVFSNEDLGKSLSELGLHNRQALIVVPHQRASSYDRGNSSSDRTDRSYNDSSVVNSGGYFASIRRTLSYFNPLSYLGGNSSSSSSGQAQSGMWEYGPNSAARNNLASSSSERPFPSNSPNQSSSSPGRNDSRSRQRTSGFGSNIHTLKHDEDDSQFSDRNAFWNGNSTQYGGNNDSK
ncbi:plant UBX domain-containing protein 11 isoform X2 [Euphorbia lathyris]|uniref:plant UBX domain-containing protein 11 isoform X2 n=1 Tax=Euphorbia lathyris TaxID=212925 RepID=UPI003313DF9C